jgi:hypothetical protein
MDSAAGTKMSAHERRRLTQVGAGRIESAPFGPN